MNGDGKPDLISADQNGAVSIFTNSGGGSFTFASWPHMGGETRFVSTTDMNGDGKTDLIIGGTGLRVLTNDGTGGFAHASLVFDEPTPALAADVNGDNKVDLISPSGEYTMKVMTNNGSGGFVFAATLNVGRYPLSAAAADVNGDGHMDLISGNADSKSLSVLTNNGSCVFTLVCSPIVGFCPRVAAADINGDGKPDLISANTCEGTFSVLINVPTLTLNRSGNDAIVSWPSAWTNWRLQQNSDLLMTDWTIFNGTIGDNGVTKSATNSASAGNNFFRLVYP